jgi:hypothetical protein
MFVSGYSSGGVLDWLTVAVPSCFALGWLVHSVLGPTCACHVMTPVQNARLGALARTRPARKVLTYLSRRAQTSQGGAVRVETDVPAIETGPLIVAGISFKRPRLPDSLEREPGHDENLDAGSSRLYPVVSFAALLNAACLFSLLLWDSYPLRAVQVLFIVGLIALGITCAASSRRRRRSDIASWFKWIGWVLFSVNGLIFSLWYGYGIYLAGLARPEPGLGLNYVQQMLRISPHGSRLWFWVVLVDACFSMLVGLVGLLAILVGRPRTPPAPPG